MSSWYEGIKEEVARLHGPLNFLVILKSDPGLPAVVRVRLKEDETGANDAVVFVDVRRKDDDDDHPKKCDHGWE